MGKKDQVIQPITDTLDNVVSSLIVSDDGK